jgi:hypothetical protein
MFNDINGLLHYHWPHANPLSSTFATLVVATSPTRASRLCLAQTAVTFLCPLLTANSGDSIKDPTWIILILHF